ncbi:MAG: hypothetical protein PHG65_06275 [Kiritimatiellae bacterium]|nr:hypothetical protein [Kiritimatiellia bacterium]
MSYKTKKRLVGCLISVLIFVFLLEIFSALLLGIRDHSWPYSATSIKLTEHLWAPFIQKEQGETQPKDDKIIARHPYLGFVYNADRNTPFNGRQNTAYGFYSEYDAVLKRSNDQDFIVVVLGGSVATHLCVFADDVLRKTLEECPALKGRTIRFNPICQGGYKQPQQLLALAYYLSLGTEVDMVINIDGVNELYIYYKNARVFNIDPSFPLHWAAETARNEKQPALLDFERRVAAARERESTFYSWAENSGWVRSALVRFLGRTLHIYTAKSISDMQEKVETRVAQQGQEGTLTYEQTGPVYADFEKDPELFEEASRLWERSNLLIDTLLHGLGIPYLVCIQPNQYFAGTRDLLPTEKESAYHTESEFYYPLANGYTHLLKAKDRLMGQGVSVADLTGIFNGEPEPIYADECCHYTLLGNQILAREVGRAACQTLMDAHSTNEAE